MEEIVVTAQFRAENVQDTPIAITAMDAATLERRGIESVTDMAASAPNVQLKESYGIYSGTTAYIRGIGQFDSQIAIEPGVAIYLDDVYHATMVGSNYSLLDLDRVEILRGPQGTLAGANSIGGAIKMYQKKPTGKGDGYAEVGYGENDSYILKGAFDTALVDNRLFLRISGGHRSMGGYIDRVDYVCENPSRSGNLPRQVNQANNCKIGEAGGFNTTTARAALRWLPTDNLEVNLTADSMNTKQDAPPMVLAALNITPQTLGFFNAEQTLLHGVQFDSRFMLPYGSYKTYATYTDLDRSRNTFSPNSYSKNNGFGLTLDYKLTDNLNLTSISAYRQTKAYGANDTDGSPLSVGNEAYYWDIETFTQELRLNGKLGPVDWTVGGYYLTSHQNLDGFVNAQGVRAPIPPLAALYPFGTDILYFITDDRAVRDKQSLFANATYHIIDDLNLTVGLRYSNNTFNYNQRRVDPQGFDPLIPTPTPKPQYALPNLGKAPEQGTERLDYRVALDYKLTDDVMVYGQVATGFKDGGINPTATSKATQTPFNEEKLKAYELGVKSKYFDNTLRLNAAAFYSDYTDLQLRISFPDGTSPTTNVGHAIIRGLELETEWAPTRAWLLSANGSYINFEYGNLGGAQNISGGPCQSCTNIYTPKYTGYLAAQYAFDLGSSGTITPQLNGEYQSKLYTDAVNRPAGAIEARWLANARISWDSADGNWKTTLAINNLFDKYYYTQMRNGLNNQGFASAAVGRPREAMLTVRKSF
ncbi:MAG: TonB-dependent receptor [Steroidobacteraceae bacterium]